MTSAARSAMATTSLGRAHGAGHPRQPEPWPLMSPDAPDARRLRLRPGAGRCRARHDHVAGRQLSSPARARGSSASPIERSMPVPLITSARAAGGDVLTLIADEELRRAPGADRRHRRAHRDRRGTAEAARANAGAALRRRCRARWPRHRALSHLGAGRRRAGQQAGGASTTATAPSRRCAAMPPTSSPLGEIRRPRPLGAVRRQCRGPVEQGRLAHRPEGATRPAGDGGCGDRRAPNSGTMLSPKLRPVALAGGAARRLGARRAALLGLRARGATARARPGNAATSA